MRRHQIFLLVFATWWAACAVGSVSHVAWAVDASSPAAGASAALALAYAGWRDAHHRRAWLLLAAGAASWVAGDIGWAAFPDAASPSAMDGLYLLGYPLMALGLFSLSGRPRGAGCSTSP